MWTVGWVLGMGASLVLGPFVYLLARLLEAGPGGSQWVPVGIPARAVTSSGFRRV